MLANYHYLPVNMTSAIVGRYDVHVKPTIQWRQFYENIRSDNASRKRVKYVATKCGTGGRYGKSCVCSTSNGENVAG